VCGLVASAVGGSGEVTLRAPPTPWPATQDGSRLCDALTDRWNCCNAQALLATGRLARLDIAEIAAASFLEAEMPPAGHRTAIKEITILRAASSVDPSVLWMTA